MNEYGEVDEMRSEGARIYAQKPNLGQRGITWSLSVSFSRSPPLPLPPPAHRSSLLHSSLSFRDGVA